MNHMNANIINGFVLPCFNSSKWYFASLEVSDTHLVLRNTVYALMLVKKGFLYIQQEFVWEAQIAQINEKHFP